MTYETEVFVTCLSLFVTVALLQVVSMVEGMQRSTTMLSVTGYVTLALSGASQGILPEFWLEKTDEVSLQCSDIIFSRHPSFREVLSISSTSLSPGHVLPARAGEHDVEDWSCREQ